MHAITVTVTQPFQLATYVCNYSKINKNTPGVKKVRGQSETALQIGMCDQKL